MRAILALLIVLGACWVSHTYSEHHEGSNAFETLYMHLVPAKLVAPEDHAEESEHGGSSEPSAHGATVAHGEQGAHGAARPLLEVPLPAFLGVSPRVG